MPKIYNILTPKAYTSNMLLNTQTWRRYTGRRMLRKKEPPRESGSMSQGTKKIIDQEITSIRDNASVENDSLH